MANYPKPSKLKLLQGKAGHRPVRDEPELPSAVPEAPDYLTDAARAEWTHTAPLLKDNGLIAMPDRQVFARYCTLVARIAECEEQLKVEGLTRTSPNGYPQQHPLIAIINSCSKQLVAVSDRFGMSPRARLTANVELKRELDEFDRFLARDDY